MDPNIAADMIDKLQQMPEDKQRHFKMTMMHIMQCYLRDDVLGALMVHYDSEDRSAIVSIGLMEEDIVDYLTQMLEVLTGGADAKEITIQ